MSRRAKRWGRPTALSPWVADRILEVVADGNHITTACAAAGVSRAALYRWLDKARMVDLALEAGEPVDSQDLDFRDFRDRLAYARARAQIHAVSVIRKSMEGGSVIEEKPVQDAEGKALRDDNGEILWRRKFTAPDGRLALAFLGRHAPKEWGRVPQQIDLT